MSNEYIRSLGFVPCEFGCGGWVHPNPSDPTVAQSVKNHLCLPRLRVVMDEFEAQVPRQHPSVQKEQGK